MKGKTRFVRAVSARRKKFLFFVIALFCAASLAGGAEAASRELIFEGGKLFAANPDGSRTEIPDSALFIQSHRLADDAPVHSLVLSDHNAAVIGNFPGVAPGTYFWAGDGRPAGFLPQAGEVRFGRDFDGRDIMSMSPESGFRVFYEWPSLKEIGRIEGANPEWLPDGRVVYTSVDRKRTRPDSYRDGWSSVAVSRPDGSGRAIVAQATATDDYTFIRLEEKGGKVFLFIQQESVKNERDWANEDPNSDDDPVETDFFTVDVDDL